MAAVGTALDPVDLTLRLIRCPSVTPSEGGALDLLQAELAALGFVCHRLPFEEPGTDPVDNLYARLGTGEPHFCFAGHSDVVPVGRLQDWQRDPFAGTLENGLIHGRGAADMKGAIGAFVAAVSALLAERGAPGGSISLLITGDEEGPSVNGTRKMLGWLAERGERIDHCVVGEPTNPESLGDMIKVGRRGSLNVRLTVNGTQGHTAYPHLADNPVHRLVAMLHAVIGEPLDQGSEHFQPSTLQVSTVDVGNPATNVIPARASAGINVRFGDRHSSQTVVAWLRERFERVGGRFEMDVQVSGEPFLCPSGDFAELVAGAIARVTGRRPELSTSGGTSDARFIKDHCPVVEFGLVGRTMHKVDEQVPAADVQRLAQIYRAILEDYFR